MALHCAREREVNALCERRGGVACSVSVLFFEFGVTFGFKQSDGASSELCEIVQ